jgi:hypothetical protein
MLISGLADTILEYLNGWPDKLSPVRLSEYGAELPSLRMLPSGGASVLRGYTDGTSVCGWDFSVSLRDKPGSTADPTLSALCDYLCFAELPALEASRTALAIELCSAPHRTSAAVSGYVEYTAEFRLIYADANT